MKVIITLLLVASLAFLTENKAVSEDDGPDHAALCAGTQEGAAEQGGEDEIKYVFDGARPCQRYQCPKGSTVVEEIPCPDITLDVACEDRTLIEDECYKGQTSEPEKEFPQCCDQTITICKGSDDFDQPSYDKAKNDFDALDCTTPPE